MLDDAIRVWSVLVGGRIRNDKLYCARGATVWRSDVWHAALCVYDR